MRHQVVKAAVRMLGEETAVFTFAVHIPYSLGLANGGVSKMGAEPLPMLVISKIGPSADSAD